MEEADILYCDDAAAWTAWLDAQHETSAAIWLAIAKKGSDRPSVTYKEAVECALCFGWIDGHKKSLNDTHYLQRFTPRAARSIWSVINRETATRLIDSGRMRPAGLRAVERAKADGRWDAAYASHSTAELPPDLAKAIADSQKATEFFDTLTSQNRFALIFRVGNVRREQTRRRKIAEYVAMLERGETIYPQGPTADGGASGG